MDRAKTYYIKAVSITDNKNEEAMLKRKLADFATQMVTN